MVLGYWMRLWNLSNTLPFSLDCHFPLRLAGNRSTEIVHCDKSIWRPGNIPAYSWDHYTSYSREIYAPLKSLLWHGFFYPPYCIAEFCPSFVFPSIAGIFPSLNLGQYPAFYGVGKKWCQLASSGGLDSILAGYNFILFHHNII